jgi:two-component system nitrogen regulation response regulator GlnG
MSHVLIVDDEESICWGLQRLLTETGHDVSVAASAEEALDSVSHHAPDLVVLDVRLPGMDGLSAMEHFGRQAAGVPIVVITAFGNLDVAVTALGNGAVDYLPKPFDLEQAAAVIDRALAHRRQPAGTSAGGCAAPSGENLGTEILGTSAAMQEVFKRIALVAPSDASVLITGESGTGKELVARAIHRHSLRGNRPFVPIHLAALSPTLVESELFGHVRGAFTGADNARQGLLELADGATVFFDEAGDIPPAVQVKLLRVLEQHEVTPVGSAEARPSSFRVIAATHRDMSHDRADATLRRDLYYRLAAFEIVLPPLRQRVEDIPLLAEHFLQRSAGVGSAARLTREALDELCRRRWPGNVRQLRHAVEHGALLARGGWIAIEHLPPHSDDLPPVSPSDGLQTSVRQWTEQQLAAGAHRGQLYPQFLSQVESPLFDAVLHSTAGNRAAAADILGIHRATLRKKIHGGDEA